MWLMDDLTLFARLVGGNLAHRKEFIPVKIQRQENSPKFDQLSQLKSSP